VAEGLRDSNVLVNCINIYALFKGSTWFKGDRNLEKLRKTVLSVTLQTTEGLLNMILIKQIGEGQSKDYAKTQSQLGQLLNSFILTATGNLDPSKEVLNKGHNFLSTNKKHGLAFLKKLMKKIDFGGYVEFIEERFLSSE
jgi:hypothetical protein